MRSVTAGGAQGLPGQERLRGHPVTVVSGDKGAIDVATRQGSCGSGLDSQLGLYDCADLRDAEPGTLRYRLLSLPARLVRHARARVLKISRTWPWREAFLTCWQRLCALPAPA